MGCHTTHHRGCRCPAKLFIWRVFKDYYNVDLDTENYVENHVGEVSSCNLTYMVRFFKGERGGGNLSLALGLTRRLRAPLRDPRQRLRHCYKTFWFSDNKSDDQQSDVGFETTNRNI